MPDAEELRRLFRYDAEAGSLYWRAPNNYQKSDALTSVDATTGYCRVYYKGRLFYAHRIIWTMFRCPIPTGYLIDHIDHDKTNNRLLNLRLVSRRDSNRNLPLRRTNTSGTNGVYWYPRNKRWIATIGGGSRKKIHLGSFASFEDAVRARDRANRAYGYHPNHGAKEKTLAEAGV